jgi:FkbM family methyltransferase
MTLKAFAERLARLHKFARSAGAVRGPRLLWQVTRKSFPVLASLPGGRTIELRPRTSDQYILEEVFVDRAYDVELGFEPEYIVDAGANIGCFTAWAAARYPGARIVAVEPDPGNLLMLVRNTAGLDRVCVVAGALWPEDRPLLLDGPGDDPSAFTVSTASEVGRPVLGISIGTLLREQGFPRIDLLKMDIEGAERELFGGDTGWLAATRTVLIELHDRTMPGCEETFLRAVGLHGFECRKHSDIMVARRKAA